QEVAAECDDAPYSYCIAVDSTDKRFREVREHFKGAILALGQAFDEIGGGTQGMRARIFQIPPSRESPTFLIASEHGAADVVIVLHRCEVVRYALIKIIAPGVTGLRPA